MPSFQNTTIFSLCHAFLFNLVIPAMIKLFKRNTSAAAAAADDDDDETCYRFRHHPHSVLGLGLATAEARRPPNVLESAMMRPNNANAPSSPSSEKRVPIGSLDEVVTGLASCTESLGFESSDEIHNSSGDCSGEKESCDDEIWRKRRTAMKAEGRGKVRWFPPPLSSLNRNGKPRFYLRPVRKDGRLELTEVRIERSEILHASRHNGRLTLHLVPDLLEEEEEEIAIKEEEEERVEEWRLSGVGRSEGLRRCHEMVSHQHHRHGPGNMRMCGISIVRLGIGTRGGQVLKGERDMHHQRLEIVPCLL